MEGRSQLPTHSSGGSFSKYSDEFQTVTEAGEDLIYICTKCKLAFNKEIKAEVPKCTKCDNAEFEEKKDRPTTAGKKQKASLSLPGMRRYRSSDGYEVLVGRTARDNDQLTFRVARPNDLWLHAGDYPGSHVIVRNSSRSEIPQRTIIEAAQLAAKFSQASKDSKVAIHYTRRKFLSKPKGAAPGLVRMSSFKTITVEPGENIERIK